MLTKANVDPNGAKEFDHGKEKYHDELEYHRDGVCYYFVLVEHGPSDCKDDCSKVKKDSYIVKDHAVRPPDDYDEYFGQDYESNDVVEVGNRRE